MLDQVHIDSQYDIIALKYTIIEYSHKKVLLNLSKACIHRSNSHNPFHYNRKQQAYQYLHQLHFFLHLFFVSIFPHYPLTGPESQLDRLECQASGPSFVLVGHLKHLKVILICYYYLRLV